MPLVHDPNALPLADVVGYSQHIGIGAAARFVHTLEEPVDAKYHIDFYSALLRDQADAEAVADSIDWKGKIFAAADQEEAKKAALKYHQEKLGGQFAMQLRNPDTKEHYLVRVTQEGWWAWFVLFPALAAAYPRSPNDNAQTLKSDVWAMILARAKLFFPPAVGRAILFPALALRWFEVRSRVNNNLLVFSLMVRKSPNWADLKPWAVHCKGPFEGTRVRDTPPPQPPMPPPVLTLQFGTPSRPRFRDVAGESFGHAVREEERLSWAYLSQTEDDALVAGPPLPGGPPVNPFEGKDYTGFIVLKFEDGCPPCRSKNLLCLVEGGKLNSTCKKCRDSHGTLCSFYSGVNVAPRRGHVAGWSMLRDTFPAARSLDTRAHFLAGLELFRFTRALSKGRAYTWESAELDVPRRLVREGQEKDWFSEREAAELALYQATDGFATSLHRPSACLNRWPVPCPVVVPLHLRSTPSSSGKRGVEEMTSSRTPKHWH